MAALVDTDGLRLPSLAEQFEVRIGVQLREANWDMAHWLVESCRLQAGPSKPVPHAAVNPDPLKLSVAEIGLSVRTTQAIEGAGIFTVEELLERRREDLVAIPNFGQKCLDEVFKALEHVGLRRSNFDPPRKP